MAFNTTQQSAFNRQINKMREDGFFLPAQRSLAGDTRYLIVSYGGTGAAALFGVKKQFENILPKAELESRVRFLAIDTDSATQKSTKKIQHPDGSFEVVELDALTGDQFIQLSGSPARLCLEGDANVSEWINPQLRQQIIHDNSKLDGTGASGTRQIGRLTLYPSTNVAAVTAKIRKLAAELTNNNHHPLRVFILSGIAGGTGSGTVIDLTYLIRSTLESMPGNLDSAQKNVPTRSKYCGFILLPPTGDSIDPVYVERGNRNGYAALKEINYFMNIDARLGQYSLTYGNGQTVTSGKNIFDVCYLLDGTSDGVAFSNPRDKAISVLAESILDMVTASQTTAEGTQVQTVDSFMNDQSTTRNGMIASKSVANAMRDADYTYCALGHSEFAMPIHEIKAYVAKQMFDKIHQLFLNCNNVDEDDVTTFLKNVLRKGASTKAQTVRSMDEEITTWFTQLAGGKGGPYFVVNLLRDLVEEVRRQRNKTRLFRIGSASNETLDYIEQYALYVNNTTFDVYTAAMTSLKDMMGDQYGVVVKAGTNGNSYTFIPESMGSIGNVSYVIEYLNGLINRNTLNGLTNALLHEMISNKQQWTALISSDDPTAGPNAMRRFWNSQLDKIIRATIEDFLIKFYSGNSEAYYSIENHNQTYPFLEQAANAIYNQMLGVGGAAQPMAGFTGKGLQPNDFNGHTYLLVPECAPNLYNELCRIAAGAPAGLEVKVCTSLASDRISCYKQYTSIPAFKLAWVCDAEEDYEKGIKTIAGVGVHMSETAGGNQWKTFPNLLPMSTWPTLPKTRYDNPRERALAERAAHLFDRANELKLTTVMQNVAGVQNLDYSVRVLPLEFRPDDALFRDLDRCVEGTEVKKQKLAAIDDNAEKCATALFAKIQDWGTATAGTTVPDALDKNGIRFCKRDLAFSDSVLTVGPTDTKPDDWDAYMAKCMLRKLPNVMNEVSGTVMVMDKLMVKVNKAVQAKSLITLFAQYLITDMFRYNADTQMWQYLDENGFPEDLTFIANDMQKLGEYYYMFDAFRNNPDPIIAKLTPKMLTLVPVPGGTDMAKKAQSFILGAKAFRQKLEDWNRQPPIDPYLAVMQSVGYNVKAIKNFHRALFAEFNTMALMGYIPVITAAPEAQADDLENDFLF